jgi:hypothetical protein
MNRSCTVYSSFKIDRRRLFRFIHFYSRSALFGIDAWPRRLAARALAPQAAILPICVLGKEDVKAASHLASEVVGRRHLGGDASRENVKRQ